MGLAPCAVQNRQKRTQAWVSQINCLLGRRAGRTALDFGSTTVDRCVFVWRTVREDSIVPWSNWRRFPCPSGCGGIIMPFPADEDDPSPDLHRRGRPARNGCFLRQIAIGVTAMHACTAMARWESRGPTGVCRSRHRVGGKGGPKCWEDAPLPPLLGARVMACTKTARTSSE